MKAKEFRDLLFQLPYALLFAGVEAKTIKPLTKITLWYLKVLEPEATSEDLAILSSLAKDFEVSLDESGLRGVQTSGYCVVKNHELSKYPLFEVLFEAAEGSSTDAGENAHIGSVAIPYQMSNKRDTLKFVSFKFVISRY